MADGKQIASLHAKIGADISPLKRGLSDAKQAMQETANFFGNTGKAIQGHFKSIGISAKEMEKLGDIGTKMTFGLTLPFAAGAAAATKMAFDVTETKNLFAVAMGGMSESANAWVNTMHEALGLTESDVQRNLGTFQAMFRGMQFGERAAYDLSKGLTQLAYDMASFFNISNEDAFTKLRAGIMGETEPLRQLGIVILETTVEQYALANGLIKSGQQMTENQKIAARYGLIMQQTALVQGDLARTSESGSNQLRRMGSEFATLTQMIGTEFEPAATSALTWINNEGFPMVTAGLQTMKVEWGKMSVGSQEHVLQLAGSLLAGGPLLMGLSFAYKAVVGFREAWKVLRLSAVAEIVAIGGALYGLIRAGAAFGKMKDEGLDVFTAWSNAGSDVDQTIGGWINGMKDMGDELLKNTGLSMDLEGAIGTYGDILAENKAKTEASRKALEGQANALDIVKGAWNSGGAAVANGGAKMKAVADQIKQAMNEAKNAMQSLANTPLAGERAADDKVFEIEQQIKRWSVERSIVLQNLQNKPKDAVEAEAWDLENRINGWRELAQRAREEAELLFDPQKREIQRLLPYQELSADAIKAGILQQLTIYKAAERGVIAANPELAPMAGLGQIMQTPAVLADVTKQGADVATVLGKGITDGLSTSGFGQKLIEALTDQLKKVKIDLGPWHLSSAGFELHLTVTAPQSGGSGSSSGSGETVPGYASGTPYVPYTGLALVHQGEAIIPASQNNGTGSGDVNINFTGDIHVRNDGDIRRIAKEIYNEFAKSGNALNLARSRGA